MSRVLRWDDLDAVPGDAGPSVVTLGNFDGVHRGHREVLSQVVASARARGHGTSAVAITFEPHPLHVLYPETAPPLLTGLRHRLSLMAGTGLDATLVIPFTREFAAWSPERFTGEVLADALGAVEVVVGQDIRFGARNAGDLTTLRELGSRQGFEVTALADVTAEPRSGRWSSTQVRELLAQGDVESAAAALSRPHRVGGTVVHGDHRGRELGYPTANLGPDPTAGSTAGSTRDPVEGMIPGDGVYAGWLVRLDLPEGAGERVLPAAVSVGTNPTFDGAERRVEAYVLDRDDLDLYGERVAVELVSRLRPTVRFDDVAALVDQMADDVERCRERLRAVVPGSV